MLFTDMQLNGSILKALGEMQIEKPTDIQETAIPKILDTNAHILAQAKTGTGKTLAFAIPIAEKIDPKMNQVQAVIMVPTRELCKQVHGVFADLSKHRKIKTVEVYGGVDIKRQIFEIHEGAQIIIDLKIYERGKVSFKHVEFVALDEADRMLDMGFFPDIEYLLLTAMSEATPRLLLFSATLLEQIDTLAKKFTKNKNIVEINVSEDELTVENCAQYYYMIDEFRDKYYHFVRILQKEHPKHSIIFVNTKRTGEWLHRRLSEEKRLNLKIDMIQGNLTQRKREIVLTSFRNRKINCLIATDVAARGLYISEVPHVFNYHIPQFEENYLHRIGRTSRVQTGGDVAAGTAISLVLDDQYKLLCRIEGFMNKEIKKLPLPPRPPGSKRPRENQQGSSQNRRQGGSNRSNTSSYHGRRDKRGGHTPGRKRPGQGGESGKSRNAGSNRTHLLY